MGKIDVSDLQSNFWSIYIPRHQQLAVVRSLMVFTFVFSLLAAIFARLTLNKIHDTIRLSG